MTIELRKLTTLDSRDIYDMLQEIPQEENGFYNNQNGVSYEEYRAWLANAALDAEKTELEDGWKVPQAYYWFYVDGQPVGMCKFRRFLTEKLLERGGHIGYAIRPTARGRGFGKLMLAEMLKAAPSYGVDRALITVDRSNEASCRVALANGGIREERSPDCYHFWIDCK